jgi:hypothetical protein
MKMVVYDRKKEKHNQTILYENMEKLEVIFHFFEKTQGGRGTAGKNRARIQRDVRIGISARGCRS